MKDFEKFLRNSQQLEAFQTARKAKEVGEIQKFNEQLERRKRREFEQILELERAAKSYRGELYDTPDFEELQWEKEKVRKFGDPDIDGQQWEETKVRQFEKPELVQEEREKEKAQNLEELDGFEQQVQHANTNAAGNEFDVIAELQQDIYMNAADNEFNMIAELQGLLAHTDKYAPELKQLPEVSSDAFIHDLTPFTETELQRELKYNEDTLREAQGSPKRLELKIQPKKAESDIPGKAAEKAESTEKNETSDKKTNTETVFFFHPPTNSKK